jgi:ABC-type polysaccharide/polyol phosphate transport system ATPase subunit
MEKTKRIAIDGVSKNFMIGRKSKAGILSGLLALFSGKEPQRPLCALKNLSFSVYPGEIVGIIGDNGSGKSTLLRIIAGIYQPDGGKVSVNGKIISIINLFVGLKDRLDMKENIFLVGSLFGMSQARIKEEFGNIVEFSELQEFVNTKIYQFSSGMLQRLAFSTAIHCNPQILLLDEVFEVGDEQFKKKSAGRLKELASNGVSIILVGHDLDIINKYCTRTIWLKEGTVVADGATQDITEKYINKE